MGRGRHHRLLGFPVATQAYAMTAVSATRVGSVKHERGGWLFRGGYALLMIAVVTTCAASDDTVRDTAHKQGLSDVEVGEWAPLSCDRNDLTSTGFCAKNAHGERVCGVVCCGLFKRCTVRW